MFSLGAIHFSAGPALSVLLLLCVLVVIGFTAWQWRALFSQSTGGKQRPWQAALLVLRLVIVLLLVVTLMQPTVVHVREFDEKPTLVVLVDNSASMQTKDVTPTGVSLPDAEGSTERAVDSRQGWAAQWQQSAAWQTLNNHYTVVTESLHTADEAKQQTDIALGLSTVLNRHPTMRAMLLLSDGSANTGPSPLRAAVNYRLQRIPVYAVGVGSDAYLPDIEVAPINAPRFSLLGEKVSLPVKVINHLDRHVQTTVQVYEDETLLVEKTITLKSHEANQAVVVFTPSSKGTKQYRVEVPKEKDELLPDNNAQQFSLAVRQEILRVLVIDSYPRWEYRFLRNALMRDPGVEANTLLLHPGMGPGGGYGYLSAFPESKEVLSQYDVIFLGDVGFDGAELKPKHAEMIAGLVREQGSGLVFMPGPRGRHITWVNTPLAELLPVSFDLTQPKGLRSSIAQPLVLTEEGRGHFLTLLSDRPEDNGRLWAQLPGFYWYTAVSRHRAGASVLAVHGQQRNQWGRIPMLATQHHGNGKVLFMGTDSAWRWRKGVEDTYHYRLWAQVVRWMAHKRHLAKSEGIRAFFTPENPAPNEWVDLQATVYDQEGLPSSQDTVTVTLRHEKQVVDSFVIDPSKGGWGVYRGKMRFPDPGKYHVHIQAAKADRELTTQIDVQSVAKEKIGSPGNFALLQDVTNATSGQFASYTDATDILTKLSSLPRREAVQETMELWAQWWWGSVLLFFLALYWAGRKSVGWI